MRKWPITPLKGHVTEVSIRKGSTPAEILSVTNTTGFVRSLDVFDKQVFSEDVSNYKLVRRDDLAYNPSRINVGSVARCDFPEGGAVSPMYVVVRCQSSLLPQFLLYFLKSGVGLQHIAHRGVGAVRFVLRFRDLEQIELPLPPIPEQERIVRILSEAEAIRGIRAEADRRQRQMLPSLLDQVLAADLTSAHNRTPLLHLVDANRGISYGVVQRGEDVDDGTPLVRIGDFSQDVLDPQDMVRVAPAISAQYARTVLQGGEIIVSIRGTVGRVAIVPPSAAGWNVAREVAVVPLLPQISRRLVYAYLLSADAQHFMFGETRGAAQSGINLEDLRKLPIPKLSPEFLERFETASDRLDTMAAAQADSRRRLNDLFQSLLNEAARGEL